MAVITQQLLAFTYAGIKTNFDLAYLDRQQAADWAQIATELPTTLPVQNYAFLGRGVVVEKFIDRVREQGLNPQTYFVADDVYKGNMKIERRIIEDDQTNLIYARATELGGETVRAWNRLVYKGLEAGFSSLCYDGQYFFDNDHTASGATYTNVTTSPLSDAALDAAQAAMGLFVDDKGEPLEVTPDTLVVGPQLARRAWDLVGSPIVVIKPGDGAIGTGATTGTDFSNWAQGRYRVIVSPYIRGYHWFLMDTKRAIKPLFIQSRADVPWSVETDMMDGAAKIKDEYNFSVRGRYGLGYGLWQTAYGSTASS